MTDQNLPVDEITPEMIEAGAEELMTYDRDHEPAAEAVARILNAVFGHEVVPIASSARLNIVPGGLVRAYEKAVFRAFRG